ncbi:MAG: transcription antitermination factor NusB [Clostridiales bacterium]|nr:transcription antitermination factor NusB [Clostridiales bacterium]
MRSYAREVAFCKIYTYLMTGVDDANFSQFDQTKLDEDDVKFATELVSGVVSQKEELDKIISEFSRSFKLSRIYRPDLAALEMALYEMINMDTPRPVVINEAVSIVKKYSTDKSVSYVNGILAAYLRSLK